MTRPVVLACVALEVAVLGVLIALSVRAMARDQVDNLRQAVGVTSYLAVITLALLVLWRGWWAGRRWARVPLLTVQLLGLFAVGWPLLRAGQLLPAVGVALVCGSAAVALLVSSRPAARSDGGDPSAEPTHEKT